MKTTKIAKSWWMGLGAMALFAGGLALEDGVRAREPDRDPVPKVARVSIDYGADGSVEERLVIPVEPPVEPSRGPMIALELP